MRTAAALDEKGFGVVNSGVKPLLLFLASLFFLPLLIAQRPSNANESATAAAESERKIMEATLSEVLELAGRETERGKRFVRAQSEWVAYVKTQAEADADGASGEARYPQAYFETMRELTRFRTRTLEGCLGRLKAEKEGKRIDLASPGQSHQGGDSQARDWKTEVGDAPLATGVQLYSANFENSDGVLAGQWCGEEESLWRGTFFADRGDTMVLYGGKMERGGLVFEAWQENARIGRGYVRQEDDKDPTWRGRFFDERRRESAIVLKPITAAKPVSYQVAMTQYTGLAGDEEAEIRLEWHDSRYVKGVYRDFELRGQNYDSGRVFLEEWEAGEGGRLVGMWSLEKASRGGSVRWAGIRRLLDGQTIEVDFGR